MALWQTAGLAFFVYVVAVAAISPARRRQLGRVATGAAIGAMVVLGSAIQGQPVWWAHWIAPAAVLLIAYWTSGLLFTAPDFRQERVLVHLDARLRIRCLARRTPLALAEIFESAYAGVYLLVPLALLVRQMYLPYPDPHGFWSVVLITDFICFAMLPWVQTRPPRALEGEAPWNSAFRHSSQYFSKWSCRRSVSGGVAGHWRTYGHSVGDVCRSGCRVGRRGARPISLFWRCLDRLVGRPGSLAGADVTDTNLRTFELPDFRTSEPPAFRH